MNADVEKAVTVMLAKWPSFGQAKATITQALRDQEAEIADLKVDRDSWADQASDRVKDWDDMRQRAEKAEALLRECDAVARKRGDKYGLCDAIDNDGQPYQSAHLAAHLGGPPMTDLIAELAEVVRLMCGFDRQRFTAELERWFRTHHAEIEAMARDAARYRWLRERVDWKPLPEDSAGKVYLVATMVSAVYGNTDDQTDAAIDAAMHDSARAKL